MKEKKFDNRITRKQNFKQKIIDFKFKKKKYKMFIKIYITVNKFCFLKKSIYFK